MCLSVTGRVAQHVQFTVYSVSAGIQANGYNATFSWIHANMSDLKKKKLSFRVTVRFVTSKALSSDVDVFMITSLAVNLFTAREFRLYLQ